jgi:SAM-dependent methyltransferase
MEPEELGRRYDALAFAWRRDMEGSEYGLGYLLRAIALCARRRCALDAGCGAGGRMINELLLAGFRVTGLDVSGVMIELARAAHPTVHFKQADICAWEATERYDLVLAWDSTFHVPHAAQRRVVDRLCRTLEAEGVLLFTAGCRDGEIVGEMGGQQLYYSSLAAHEYVHIVTDAGCDCVLLERDQYPEEHIVVLAVRRGP